MALTMTRTRTQTTLTKLAMLVANVHGELAFVERLLDEARAAAAVTENAGDVVQMQNSRVTPQQKSRAMVRAVARERTEEMLVLALKRRHHALLRMRESLYATVRQFDPGLDPAEWAGLGSGEVKQPLAQKCAGGAGTPQGRSPMVQPFRATEVRIYR